MSKIYTNKNKIKFTDISEKYKVNRSLKGRISSAHAMIITYVVSNFIDTKKYKEKVVYALNLITYYVYADEIPPFDWSPDAPFTNLPDIDRDMIEETLGDILLTVEGITWDVVPIERDEIEVPVQNNKVNKNQTIYNSNDVISNKNKKSVEVKYQVSNPVNDVTIKPTPKHDLYIQPPTFPQFDYNKPWMRGLDGADTLVIYTTLPEIPTKQNEISVTTDINKMTYEELMQLYPNCIIHTRAPIMYQPCEGIELDPDLGLIIPIEGFTREQIIDNIVRYPHIFKLVRQIDDSFSSFYSHIEIEGELHPTLDVWSTLPESNIIPRQSDFVKEYVVRRYLLERDIKKVKHNYPIFGTLEPFLTLFMSPTDYINKGYKDTEDIVKQCVISRVSYKQSRNPVIRRLSKNAELHI